MWSSRLLTTVTCSLTGAGVCPATTLPKLRELRSSVSEMDDWMSTLTLALCVVEEPKDIVAIERTNEFRGRYHVLGGAINPLEGIGPDQLRVRELMSRLGGGDVSELILATDPNTEGEATATYLALLVKPMGITVTRLASGLPVGGDLEYADEITLGRAFEGRRKL